MNTQPDPNPAGVPPATGEGASPQAFPVQPSTDSAASEQATIAGEATISANTNGAQSAGADFASVADSTTSISTDPVQSATLATSVPESSFGSGDTTAVGAPATSSAPLANPSPAAERSSVIGNPDPAAAAGAAISGMGVGATVAAEKLQNNSVFSSPASPTPQSIGGVSNPTNPYAAKPNKGGGKGKIALIVGGVIGVVLLIAAILVYFFWYQSPQKIVDDAMLKFSIAQKAQMKITTNEIAIKSGGKGVTVDPIAMNISYDMGKDFEMSMDSKLTSDNRSVRYGLDMRMTEDMDMYVRVSHILASIDELIASNDVPASTKSSLESYRSLVASVTDKWIAVPFKDIEESSKDLAETMKCMKGVMGDKSQYAESNRQLLEFYAKNKFMIAGESVSDGGKSGIRMKVDQEKLKSFIMGYPEIVREVNKNNPLLKCNKTDAINNSKIEDIPEDQAEESAKLIAEAMNDKVEMVLWVDGFSHTLKGMRIKAKIEKDASGNDLEQAIDVEANVDIEYDQGYRVTAPEGAVNFKEVAQDAVGEYQKLNRQSYPSNGSSIYDRNGPSQPMLPLGLPAINGGSL